MANCVARHVDHACVPAAQFDLVAIAHNAVDRGQALDFLRSDDLGAGGLDDGLVPAGMVRMPVRVPDLRDAPILRIGLPQVFRTIGRIDCGCFAAFGIVEKEAVIVGKAGELVNL